MKKHLSTALFAALTLSCIRQNQREGKLVFENEADLSAKVLGATINGVKQGLWISYNEDGTIFSYQTYTNDSLTGESVSFFQSGSVLAKGNLINGRREGDWVLYYDKGIIAAKGNYSNGLKIGIWEYYIEEGLLDRKIEYLKDGSTRIVQDNHLTPPTPVDMQPARINDSLNNAVTK